MKKIFLLWITLLFNLSISAQINLSQLKGTWLLYEPAEEGVIEKLFFSELTLTSSTYWKLLDSSAEYTHKYYLSSNIPSSFDFNAVGKNNTGTYIIEYNDQCRLIEAYQVVSFTEDTLILRIKILRTVIGDNIEQIVKYRRTGSVN